MKGIRALLSLLAVLGGLGTLYLATTDVHHGDRNCGTALIATDPSELTISTGDLEDDEFAETSLLANCRQRVLERRFLTLIPATTCAASLIVERRLERRAASARR